MAGQVQNAERVAADCHGVPLGQFVIGRGRLFHLQSESSRGIGGIIVQRAVKRMEPDGDGSLSQNPGNAADMIEVRMCKPDGFEYGTFGVDRGQQPIGIVSRVDEHRFPGCLVNDEPAVLLNSADGNATDNHVQLGVENSCGGSTEGGSVMSSTGDSPIPLCASQRSASSAAMQPVPADVIACR